MAVFGSLLFNRSLKKFLACKDLKSSDGQALVNKIRSSASEFQETILETISQTANPHHDVLKQICQDQIKLNSEDRFLLNLESDDSVIRAVSKNLLSESQQINPSKLFKQLQETDSAKTEIIEILEFQKQNLPPELIVKNALRMEKGYAVRLLKMATSVAGNTDMSALSIESDSLQNPDVKMEVIRFLAAANQPQSAEMICQFLNDESKIIVIEALKSLKAMSVDYDPAPIVHYIPEMREQDADTAFDILRQKAGEQTLPSLVMLMTSKQEKFRRIACEIANNHITNDSLEALLLALNKNEWYSREQAVKNLLALGNDKLFSAAATLVKNNNEFVKNTAEQLSANQTSLTTSLVEITDSLLHENWQVRERAIEKAGESGRRSILDLLMEVVQRYPESSVGVLKAVAKLGFSKGLELTSRCLSMTEAAIQREALLTTAAIVTQGHADKVRDGIIKIVPSLQATVRDTALDVINSITEKYNLPQLQLDEENIFETRLLKIEENRGKLAQQNIESAQAVDHAKTEVISFRHIEELKPGDLWMDRYKVIKEVGRGAMGRVMLVDDETVGESMILKFMHPELTSDGRARERFLRELKYSRKISHPNVIRIYDFLIRDSISAISMEYFVSHGLDYLIKHELLTSQQQILSILYQACDGMWEAHQKNVIHRDLKPSNILVNDKNYAKVLDFGIASATSESEMTLTKTGMIIGTPAYLSPERARGMEADHRADIYALGIIAYAMFNGSPPYKGEPMSLLFQHIEGKATPLHRLDKDIRASVSMLVEKMMAVDIEKRYQSMEEVRDTIKKLM